MFFFIRRKSAGGIYFLNRKHPLDRATSLALLAFQTDHPSLPAPKRLNRNRFYRDLRLTARRSSVECRHTDAGWSSLVARRAHNPKVVGSNPAPATKHQKRLLERVAFFVRACFIKINGLCLSAQKQEIVLIPKLRSPLRPFTVVLHLFEPYWD